MSLFSRVSLEERARVIAEEPSLSWQERISKLSGEFPHLAANEAAHYLGEYYVSRREMHHHHSDPVSPSTATLEVRAKEIAEEPGLTWQQRISKLSEEFDLNARDAAHHLGEYYVSRKEHHHHYHSSHTGPHPLTSLEQAAKEIAEEPGLTWQQRISKLSEEYHTSGRDSAVLLGRFYVSGREHDHPEFMRQGEEMDAFLRKMAGLQMDRREKLQHISDQLHVTPGTAAQLLSAYQA